MSYVHRITDALDRAEMAARLDVRPRSIRKAREERIFPASWYAVLAVMCAEAGIECPLEAFNWRPYCDMHPPSAGPSRAHDAGDCNAAQDGAA